MAREVFNLMFTTRTTSTIMMFGNTMCHEKLDKQQNICVRHVFVVHIQYMHFCNQAERELMKFILFKHWVGNETATIKKTQYRRYL